MKISPKLFTGLSFIIFGLSHGTYGQAVTATNPKDMLNECVSQLKSGKVEYKFELKQCIQKCKLRRNAGGALIEQCRKAYNLYRKASDQAEARDIPAATRAFEIKEMIATFGVHPSGKLIKFNLLGESSEVDKRGATVCNFRVPESQWQGDSRRFQMQFNDKIRGIRGQGKNFAYLLSDVRWTEDGSSTRYNCKIGSVDVIAVP